MARTYTKRSSHTKSSQKMAEPADSTKKGERPVYFWRPNDDWGFLGQWYESPFQHEGVEYRTAEMWMMIQKAKLFKDEVSSPLPTHCDLRWLISALVL
jgi:predicted NAD-dependent protein-ADP-ribosyltransferase YbiA (DUF1768 family)